MIDNNQHTASSVAHQRFRNRRKPRLAAVVDEGWDHQIACCRSLCVTGFGDNSPSQIEKYISSAQNWSQHLQALVDDTECRLFFPNLCIPMCSISLLAKFHDSKIRPPSSAPSTCDLQILARQLNEACQKVNALNNCLSRQAYWIDIHRLPLTIDTLNKLKHIHEYSLESKSKSPNQSDALWLGTFLQPTTSLKTQLACGNVKKMAVLLANVLSFAQSNEYKKAFGAEFVGLDTNWIRIHTNLLFFQKVQQSLRSSGLDHIVLSNWPHYEPRFFSLCRKASIVRRRLHKLNRLVKRHYFTPTESTVYLALADKSIFRLRIWLAVLKGCPQLGNLTPRQLLEKLLTH